MVNNNWSPASMLSCVRNTFDMNILSGGFETKSLSGLCHGILHMYIFERTL